MKYKYIAIEREFGSGGTKIAHAIAKRCGIPCYGREILKMVAEEQHTTVEQIDRYEESVTNSFLYTLFVLGRVQSGQSDVMTKEGHIFLAEQKVISQLAAKGPAVFIGHCAAEALRNSSGVLRVFIRSDVADKKARITEDYHIPAGQTEDRMRRFDKKRANYYYANTARKWDDPKNYELILDSGKLGEDGCAAAVCGVYMCRNS